ATRGARARAAAGDDGEKRHDAAERQTAAEPGEPAPSSRHLVVDRLRELGHRFAVDAQERDAEVVASRDSSEKRWDRAAIEEMVHRGLALHIREARQA